MVSMWLNFVCNNNEIFINVDLSKIDLFDSNELNESRIEEQLIRKFNSNFEQLDKKPAITVFFIRNQNAYSVIESKCNCSDIESDEIDEIIDSFEFDIDCYKTNDEIIDEIQSELDNFDFSDRNDVENFIDENQFEFIRDHDDLYEQLKRNYLIKQNVFE